MPPTPGEHLRIATHDDGAQLVRLRARLFDEDDSARGELWRGHAREWFAQFVTRPDAARFPLIDIDGQIVATAIGTLELGVRNPQCHRGRTVRLANVVTLPEHRGAGYGTLLVENVTEWARSIAADRVDLSATPEGQRIYARAWAIAGTGGHGAGLSCHLLEMSEIVIELDRPKRAAPRNGAKTDPLDAVPRCA